MKYSSELDIELPRQRVIELFDDPENLPKWQPGLRSFELVDGEEGQPGAKSRLVYDMDGRRVPSHALSAGGAVHERHRVAYRAQSRCLSAESRNVGVICQCGIR